MPPTESPSAPASARPLTDAVNAVTAVRKVEELTATQVEDATDWFLAESPEEDDTYTFEMNVGTRKEHWVRWSVKALDRNRIKELREAGMNRASRRSGGRADDMEVNLRIATEGTVTPDLTTEEARHYKRTDGTQGTYLDPADALRWRLRRKPGLIDQIAGQVLSASGYDDEDVREVAAGETFSASGYKESAREVAAGKP